MSALKKKDYYQFCYDENEREASFEDEHQIEESDTTDEDDQDIEDNQYVFDVTGDPSTLPGSSLATPTSNDTEVVGNQDNQHLPYKHVDTPYYPPSYDSNLEEGEAESPIDIHCTPKRPPHHLPLTMLEYPHHQYYHNQDQEEMAMMEDIDDLFSNTTDSDIGSPSSVESFTIDGYVIEIDETNDTININASSSPDTSPTSTSSDHSDSAFSLTSSSSSSHSPYFDLMPSPGMVISGDFVSSPSSSSAFLTIPSTLFGDDDYDDLASMSSGISLGSLNPSPMSSAPSLNTEIDRLRNLNSLICGDVDLEDTLRAASSGNPPRITSMIMPNKRRVGGGGDFRRVSGSSTTSDSSISMLGKFAKSLESLKSRSSTPSSDVSRKSPLSFFFSRNKGGGSSSKMSSAKSDCELSRIKKASSSLPASSTSTDIRHHRGKSSSTKKLNKGTSSFFRLKRSSSVTLKQKYRLSRSIESALSPTPQSSGNSQHFPRNGAVGMEDAGDRCASSELILQQPSPFVKTIFQFVSTDEDEMFPANSFENLTTVPIYSCLRSNKMFFQDKSGSLSRRHKYKNNLSSIVRTIAQDAREPVLLATGRRVCESSEFIIAIISYLDRIRKAKEIVMEDPSARLPLQPQSNRFERLSLRKSYMLPLSLHERFSQQFDDTSFNSDLILTGVSNTKKASNRLSSSFDDALSNGLNRSKSLKNIAFGSLRRKSKQAKQQKGGAKEMTTASTSPFEQEGDMCTLTRSMTGQNESHHCADECHHETCATLKQNDDGIENKTMDANKCSCDISTTNGDDCDGDKGLTRNERSKSKSNSKRRNKDKGGEKPNIKIVKENKNSGENISVLEGETSCCCSHSVDSNSRNLESCNSDICKRQNDCIEQRIGTDNNSITDTDNVCCNCSSSLLSADNRTPQVIINASQQKTNSNNKSSVVSTSTGGKEKEASNVDEKQKTVSDSNGTKQNTTTIRYLAGKLKKINTRRHKPIPDVEYWAKPSSTSEENEHLRSTTPSPTPQKSSRSSSPQQGVDRLREQFEKSGSQSPPTGMELQKRASSPDSSKNDAIVVVSNKEKKEETKKRSSGGLRRSLSWRLKRDKSKSPPTSSSQDTRAGVDSPPRSSSTSPQPLSKIKEKVDKPNKFSSIRSMFEPLSPSEKKKVIISPTVLRRSKSQKSGSGGSRKLSGNKSTERIVSLRYSKIGSDDEAGDTIVTTTRIETADNPLYRRSSSSPASPCLSNSSRSSSSVGVKTPPSSPDTIQDLKRRGETTLATSTRTPTGGSSGAVSSELYSSSDSSPVSKNATGTSSSLNAHHQKKISLTKQNGVNRFFIPCSCLLHNLILFQTNGYNCC